MNKLLCSLACTWITDVILLTVYLKMFHWNEMLTCRLRGCKSSKITASESVVC